MIGRRVFGIDSITNNIIIVVVSVITTFYVYWNMNDFWMRYKNLIMLVNRCIFCIIIIIVVVVSMVSIRSIIQNPICNWTCASPNSVNVIRR